MKQYRVTKKVEFEQGTIGLSDAQAATRAWNLKPVGRGRYEIAGHIEFKVGEVIGLDAVPKAYVNHLEPARMAAPASPAGSE